MKKMPKKKDIEAEIFVREMEEHQKIQDFFNSIIGAKICAFEVLQWQTDPKFRIATDRKTFTLHSNDLGIFIDEVTEHA